MWKYRSKQYKNNKPKIIAPIWNDKFELTDGSYSVLDMIMLGTSLKHMKH